MIAVKTARKEIAATFAFPECPAWEEHVDVLECDGLSRLQLLERLLKAAERYKVLVIGGCMTGYRDIALAPFIARMKRPPAMVISECTWKLGKLWADRLACRAMVRLMDTPKVSYCVLSRAETHLFPKTWGVDARRVFYTPWSHFLSHEELAAPISDDGLVFAGGDSLRDYRPLVVAARGLPVDVVIAARRFTPPEGVEMPENVRAGKVSPSRYNELSRSASVVVVPLEARQDRSAGQFTYLSAMAMGKVVIVTDVLGVRDYVEHGRTGLIVPPGDPEAMRTAIRWAIDPAHRDEVRKMRERAREAARSLFSQQRHVESLLDVAHRAMS